MWLSRVRSQRGSALIATLVVSMLLLGVLLWHLSQAGLTVKLQTYSHAGELAFNYAETGLLLAEQRLQLPGVLRVPGTVTGSRDLKNGRCDYTLIRPSPLSENADSSNPFERVLVEAVATGYYYHGQGTQIDPVQGRKAQMAVLKSTLSFYPLAHFVLASPGRLQINQGTTSNYGPIYARDLVFLRDARPEAPPVMLEAVFIGETIQAEKGPVHAPPVPVAINSTQGPQVIDRMPHFPVLGGAIRAYYKSLAVSEDSRLAAGASLDGRKTPPQNNSFPIYYCEGDLVLGPRTGLELAGHFIVYVEGNLIVQRSMRKTGDAWGVFLVEKELRLEPALPGHPMRLDGNFVVGQGMRWTAMAAPARGFSLTVDGSLLTGRDFDPLLARVPKTFFHWQVDEAVLPLPRLTQRQNLQIVRGAYRR